MPYPVCPKCGHAPLPEDQSLPAACPACGIILAKFASMPVHAATRDVDPDEEVAARPSLASWLFHVPTDVSKANFYARCVLLVAAALYTIKIFRGTDIFYGDLAPSFLYYVLTPWHEAGHVFFRLFGEFMTYAGGTILQHGFPILLGGLLLIRGRNPFGAALCLWILGYSVMYTAWYMHDAGDPQGMMLSGKSSAEDDGHDFVNIFSMMGGWWLLNATKIGVVVWRIAQAIMLAGLAWGAYMLWLQKSQLSDSPFAEAPVDRD